MARAPSKGTTLPRRREVQALRAPLLGELWAELVSQMAVSQSTTEQTMQASLSELKDHISSVFVRPRSWSLPPVNTVEERCLWTTTPLPHGFKEVEEEEETQQEEAQPGLQARRAVSHQGRVTKCP